MKHAYMCNTLDEVHDKKTFLVSIFQVFINVCVKNSNEKFQSSMVIISVITTECKHSSFGFIHSFYLMTLIYSHSCK